MQRNNLFFDLQNIFLKIKINDKVITPNMIPPPNPAKLISFDIAGVLLGSPPGGRALKICPVGKFSEGARLQGRFVVGEGGCKTQWLKRKTDD
jgi:hypothetical protein